MDGEFVDWDDAKIHILSHVIHYGSCVFEGLRCYETPRGSGCFRLRDHLRRLRDSAKIYRMDMPFSTDELIEATKELIRRNGFTSCYIRPIAYRGLGQMGVNPMQCPVRVALAVWPWGAYLGDEAARTGIDVCVSSWTRMAPNTLPLLAKAGANYMNSQLIKMEATLNGYAEGIGLDVQGNVSEGSGENLFLVKDGGIATPPSGSSILPGITRHSVIVLARELGYKVIKHLIPRESLYIADEIFLTGSAAEITPVRSVDRIPVGDGKPGPVAIGIRKRFVDIITGAVEDRYGWLDYV